MWWNLLQEFLWSCTSQFYVAGRRWKFTENTLKDNAVISDEDVIKTQVDIFFDFECTQEDWVECVDGYTPEGDTSRYKNCRKSKCVHKLCLDCLKQNLKPLSECTECGKNELVFSCINATNDFCRWLFSGENDGATVLCHIFKGYDYFPIPQYLYQNGVIQKEIVPSGDKNMSVEVPSCKIRIIDTLNFLRMAL